MKRKFKFTELRVRGVKHEPGRPKPGKKDVKAYTIYWDSAQPGLGVRVTKGGARSYVFESRVNHRTLRTTIGAVGKGGWKLGEAQAEARRLTVECVDRNIDPRIVAKQEAAKADAQRIEAQRHAHVLSAVWPVYIEACKAGWGERHLADHTEVAHMGGERKEKRDKGAKKSDKPGLTKPGPLAALMPLKLSELTADVVAKWLEREAAKRPTSAAKAFRLLRAFVRWADERPEYRGAVASDACTARSVREALPSSNAKKNDCLQKGQLTAWFTAVRALPNRVIAAYLQTLLLTGARREELARLKWADVDFVWNSLSIRDKVEGTRMIPLTPYVASLLSALPRKNKWVFPSATAEGGRLVEPTKRHNAALTAAGLPHITLHGLRRSFRTLSGWLAMPVGVVAQIMGHKPSAIAEKHYEDRPLDMLAEHHTRLEAWILEQGGVPFVALPAGRLGVVAADGSVRATA